MNSNISNYQIFPNPSDGKFNIQFYSDVTDDRNIEIVNSIGEVVYLKQFTSNDLLIDISKQKKGIYILKINDGIHFISSKIIIQ